MNKRFHEIIVNIDSTVNFTFMDSTLKITFTFNYTLDSALLIQDPNSLTFTLDVV